MKLYILKFKNKNLIKIGVSKNISSRIISLGVDLFDLNKSYFVTAHNPKTIRALEHQLLNDYDHYFVETSFSLDSGNTEIRKDGCLGSIIEDIEQKIIKFPDKKIRLKYGIKIDKLVKKRIIKPKKMYTFYGIRETLALLDEIKEDVKFNAYVTEDNIIEKFVVSNLTDKNWAVLDKLPSVGVDFTKRRKGSCAQNYISKYTMEEETKTENNLQAKIEDAKQMVADGVPVSVVIKLMGLRLVDLGL